MFASIKKKIIKVQLKKGLEQLDALEKELDKTIEENPDFMSQEDYKELKDAISGARDYADRMLKEEEFGIEEFVEFANRVGNIIEKISKKYDVNVGRKYEMLKEVRVGKEEVDISEIEPQEFEF